MKIAYLLVTLPWVSAYPGHDNGKAATAHWKPTGSNDCNYPTMFLAEKES